jgi:hypothetical protein
MLNGHHNFEEGGPGAFKDYSAFIIRVTQSKKTMVLFILIYEYIEMFNDIIHTFLNTG